MATRAVVLRLAGTADAMTLATMSRDLIETGLAWRYTGARIARMIAEPETCVLVACEGPQVLGFAVMHFLDENAHLVLLCVRPEAQRSGIGSRLLEWLLDSARVAGLASVRLELRVDNPQAQTFYRALGFAATVQLPRYYEGRVAAQCMVYALRPAQDAD